MVIGDGVAWTMSALVLWCGTYIVVIARMVRELVPQMSFVWALSQILAWGLGGKVDQLYVGIFWANDQGEVCASHVSPTVLGVKESRYGIRLSCFLVAEEPGPYSRVFMGGGGPRHNSKIHLKIA